MRANETFEECEITVLGVEGRGRERVANQNYEFMPLELC